MSSGTGSSGKPCPRLMAALSRAACDIASKMVTGRSAKTLFRDELLVREELVIGRSATDLAGKPRRLPAEHAAGQMLVIRQASRLRRERGRDGALARAAGEHDLLAGGIGDRLGIEGRERHDDTVGIGLGFDLVRLANVNEEVTALLAAPGVLQPGLI